MSVVYLEKTDTGATLTTWIYCHMWMLWAAEQQGLDGYINWEDGFTPPRDLEPYRDKKKYETSGNQFEWYFNQPKVKYPKPGRGQGVIWTWEGWKDPSPVSFMAQPLSVIKDYYKKNLHFSSAVFDRGFDLKMKYYIDFSRTIGISWRGTDNVTDGRPRLPIECYFPFIDKILEIHPDYRIMCTAEEEGILKPLLDRYKGAYLIEEFFSAPLGSKHNPERFSPRSGFERGMQPALMVWLFSKCAYYIKNRSSTGAVASWLSTGKIINLGHPETLGYEKMDDQVEIDGIRYPLYGNITANLSQD